MSGSILLPVLVIIIATVAVYIAWQNLSKKTGWADKGVLVCCYIIVLAICVRYSNLAQSLSSSGGSGGFAENFEVNIPDPQQIIDEESERAAGGAASASLVVPIVNHSLVDPSNSQVKTKYKTLPKIALKIYPV